MWKGVSSSVRLMTNGGTYALEKEESKHLEPGNGIQTGQRTKSECVLIPPYLGLWTGAGTEHLQAFVCEAVMLSN